MWELSRVTVLSAETDKHCTHLDTTYRDRNLRYFESSVPAVPVRGFLKQQSLKYSLHPPTTTFSISYSEMSWLQHNRPKLIQKCRACSRDKVYIWLL